MVEKEASPLRTAHIKKNLFFQTNFRFGGPKMGSRSRTQVELVRCLTIKPYTFSSSRMFEKKISGDTNVTSTQTRPIDMSMNL